jgi:uncharacterized protein
VRYIQPAIQSDLNEGKMAFLGGPRQVGKTTVAHALLGAPEHPGYLNWDDVATRAALLRGELPARQSLIVFDEIHKYPRWRNLVKGFYDTRKSSTRFIVTGSAKLDYYRRGGDSLIGRYHYHRLHPFSLNELGTRAEVSHLLQFGGFPEPCIKGDARFHRRWQRERMQRVLYDDVRDLEQVREISLIEVLLEALPDRVGAPLSVKSLAEDLSVSFATAERWVTILERMYVCFRILPFGAPKIRAVKKERKLFFWDWSQVTNPGARFENLVASQLLKYCHHIENTEGYAMDLRFIRDFDRREIDFVVLRDKKPLFAVECKSGEKSPSQACAYFRERTPIRRFYQVHLGAKDYGDADTSVRVLPFSTFCRELQLP